MYVRRLASIESVGDCDDPADRSADEDAVEASQVVGGCIKKADRQDMDRTNGHRSAGSEDERNGDAHAAINGGNAGKREGRESTSSAGGDSGCHADAHDRTASSGTVEAEAPGAHADAKSCPAAVNGSPQAVDNGARASGAATQVAGPSASSSFASASSPRQGGWRTKVPSCLQVDSPNSSGDMQATSGADTGRVQGPQGIGGSQSGKVALAIEQLAPLGLSLRCA